MSQQVYSPPTAAQPGSSDNGSASLGAAAPPATSGNSVLQGEKLRREQRADGPACVLAVGTANPANCIPQEEFADWYFRVTKSDHLTELKAKMKKTCEQVGIKKRYFQVTEDLLRAHPELLDPALPSIDARLHAVAASLPELAAAAARNAIADWGRPAADVTHLVVATSSGAQIPGVDVRVASLLGLRPAARRTMLCYSACAAGAAALRAAKDAAENCRGARVLAVSADALSAMAFRAPAAAGDEEEEGALFAHAVFGDGAGAVVVGADPSGEERAVFEMVSASQATIPGTERLVAGELGAAGLRYSLAAEEVPELVAGNIERILADAVAPLGGLASGGGGGWNGLFWVVHPGSHRIMDSYEKVLRLEPGKLAASRRVFREYGNMVGPTVIFVLDEVVRLQRRRWRLEEGEDGGEGCEWGLLVGLGPGFTAEVIVLRACK
ncbi:unnamed protein product [Urochloa humidicola]